MYNQYNQDEIKNLIEDDGCDEDIVTLMSSNGEEIDFLEVAGIAYYGHFYAILHPVEPLEGLAEDEALVFEVTRTEDGQDRFEIVLDVDIIDAVFEEYQKMYDEAMED